MKELGPFNVMFIDCITPLAYLALLASRKLCVPIVCDYADLEDINDTENSFFLKLRGVITTYVLKKVFRESCHIFPMSNLLKNRLIKFYRIPEDKLTLIPNGVDTKQFNPKVVSGSRVRKALGLESSTVIGFSGAIEKWCGLDLLLQTFRNIRSGYPKVKLLIVGRGPELHKLQTQSQQLGIENDVIFTGLVPYKEMPEYVASLDIAVSIFTNSLFTDVVIPLKLIEYMSMGKAVVANNLSGTRELVTDKEEGLLFDSNDCHGLEMAIRILLNDVELRKKMGERGREKALGYAWEPLARKIERELLKVSNEENPLR